MVTVTAWGHENVLSLHKTTIEVTMEPELTKKGDCIIGVGADLGPADLSGGFRNAARNKNAKIAVIFKAGDVAETVTGRGHPDLTFEHKTDMVIRKSDFICSRTLMINADKSAAELDRKLISLLKNKNQKLTVNVEILSEG
jgi:hypothetical protein